MGYEFKKGDKVFYNDRLAVIKDITGTNYWGQSRYYLEFEDDGELPAYDYAIEEEMKLFNSATPPRLCQCGAHTQRGFEEFHADWCILYEDKRY